MKRLRDWLVLGMVAACVCPAVARAQLPQSFQLPDAVQLDRFDLVRAWYTQVPMLKNREKAVSLKVEDGLLFLQSDQGMIHCIESETGLRKWSTTVAGLGRSVFRPALTEDAVYVTTSALLLKLSRETGRVMIRQELPHAASSGPSVDEDFVFIQTVDNRIYALELDPDTKRRHGDPYPIRWFFQADGALPSPPVALKNLVVLVSAEGTAIALDPGKKQIRYRFVTYTPNRTPIASRNNMLFMPVGDFDLYAIDLTNYRKNRIAPLLKWRFSSPSAIAEPPLPFAEDVFVIPTAGGVYSLDDDTGAERWRNERISTVVAVTEKRVYGIDELEYVWVVSREDGHVVGSWPARGFRHSARNVYNDRLYMSTDFGLVICLRERSSQEPYLHTMVDEDAAATKPTSPGPKAEADEPDDAPKAKRKRPSFFGPSLDSSPPAKPGEPAEKAAPKASRKSFFDDP